MNEHLEEQIALAEGYLYQSQPEAALDILTREVADAEVYIDANYQPTSELQYFNFPSMFERLAYRRVEKDPRQIQQVDEPFAALFAALAHTHLMLGNYDEAAQCLKQAIRWNPMDCASRLNLAELMRVEGNMQEYFALTHSVFDRASEPEYLARAWVNFVSYFRAAQNDEAIAACLYLAHKFDAKTAEPLMHEFEDMLSAHPMDDTHAQDVLEAEGVPGGANAEIAICLLMCAVDAKEMGDVAAATTFTLKAHKLVGADAAKALLQLIQETDE